MMLTLVSRGNLWFTKWVGKTSFLANNWLDLDDTSFSIWVIENSGNGKWKRQVEMENRNGQIII